MKIGISMSTYQTRFGPVVLRDGTLEERIRLAVRCGYDGVDLFSNISSKEEAASAAEIFKREGLEVAMYIAISLGESGVDLASRDEEKLKTYLERMKEQVEIAQILGASKIPIGFIRGARPEDEALEEYYERLSSSLRLLAPFAEERGVQLCLEPINRYEINTFNSAQESIEFLEKYPIENVELLLDAFHMNIEDSGIPQMIRRCRGHIGHFHLPDNHRRACGTGCFDFESIVGALREVDYDGYVSVEAFPIPSAEECARTSIATLRKYI